MFAVLATALVGAGAAALYWLVVERGSVFTDNAYVGGNVVQVTPQVGGTVVAIYADDTKLVEQGQALVQLDRTDADASLKETVARVGRCVHPLLRGLPNVKEQGACQRTAGRRLKALSQRRRGSSA